MINENDSMVTGDAKNSTEMQILVLIVLMVLKRDFHRQAVS